MESFNTQINEFDSKIAMIDERINAINNDVFVNRRKEGVSLDQFNELSSLKRAKKYYEMSKYDIINGTHKVQIDEIERKVIEYKLALMDANLKLKNSNVFNRGKYQGLVVTYEYTINELQEYINELKAEDNKTEDNILSLNL